MKTIFALTTFAAIALGTSHASDLTGTAKMLSYAPAMTTHCAVNNSMEGSCNAAYFFAILTNASTTMILLKEIQVAGPDALDYIAGAEASPVLLAAVERMQNIALEELGVEVSFDEAVDEILKNL